MTRPSHGCAVAGCPRPGRSRGWCVAHYRRWYRHGDPRAEVAVAARTADGGTYSAVRRRLGAERGRAVELCCADCGGAAVCWSYDGSDPHERTDPGRGVSYSLDLGRYRARCRFCHRRAVVARGADLPGGPRGRAPALHVDTAVRLYLAGATCRGIGSLMGVSKDAVRQALHGQGIELRPSGRPRRRPHPITATDTATSRTDLDH
ncbi:MAG: hypothetical protein M3Z25_22875 [Actinomycetota bacterium]|nr:hypothetical protein [Actinomycetota bacterium]